MDKPIRDEVRKAEAERIMRDIREYNEIELYEDERELANQRILERLIRYNTSKSA